MPQRRRTSRPRICCSRWRIWPAWRSSGLVRARAGSTCKSTTVNAENAETAEKPDWSSGANARSRYESSRACDQWPAHGHCSRAHATSAGSMSPPDATELRSSPSP